MGLFTSTDPQLTFAALAMGPLWRTSLRHEVAWAPRVPWPPRPGGWGVEQLALVQCLCRPVFLTLLPYLSTLEVAIRPAQAQWAVALAVVCPNHIVNSFCRAMVTWIDLLLHVQRGHREHSQLGKACLQRTNCNGEQRKHNQQRSVLI